VAYKQEVNVPLIVTIGAVSVVLLVVLIIGTEAWYDSEAQAQANLEADVYGHPTLQALKDQQMAVLNDPQHPYHWVDKSKGIVAIPIDDAIKIMADNMDKPPQ
jgi:hypothetical protein